jgi:hypothetical protein
MTLVGQRGLKEHQDDDGGRASAKDGQAQSRVELGVSRAVEAA